MAYGWIREASQAVHWVSEHRHDYDEVLIWMGSDPDNMHDLGAELYLDIEGERYVVDRTGSVYLPAWNAVYCPGRLLQRQGHPALSAGDLWQPGGA